MDLVVEGGTVVDGTGRPGFRADIGILGDRIQAIGDLTHVEARRSSAQGLLVAPGFIDIHSHSDLFLVVNPLAESAIRQGVTTLVVGNCGYSCAPAVNGRDLGYHTFGYADALKTDATWTSFGSFLQVLEELGPSVNVGALVGHAALRHAVMGPSARIASDGELRKMKSILARALDDGAIGLSTGLEYVPGKVADTRELVALSKVTADAAKFLASHVRDRNHGYLSAVEEALSIAYQSRVSLQLSHIQPRAWVSGKAYETIIQRVEEARTNLPVDADLYPYTWGMVTAASCIPAWAFADGIRGVLELLVSRTARERFRAYQDFPFHELVAEDQAERIILAHSSKNSQFQGQTMADIMSVRKTNLHQTICDLLLEEGEAFPSLTLLTNTTTEEGLAATARLAYCMFASDGVTLAHYGPLAGVRMQASSYGYAPRALQLFVREWALMPVEEAVKRMTSMPAAKAGLRQRGILREGWHADLVVFDPEGIADNTTTRAPAAYPSGIETVVVNGSVAFTDGDHTGTQTGAVLRW